MLTLNKYNSSEQAISSSVLDIFNVCTHTHMHIYFIDWNSKLPFSNSYFGPTDLLICIVNSEECEEINYTWPLKHFKNNRRREIEEKEKEKKKERKMYEKEAVDEILSIHLNKLPISW